MIKLKARFVYRLLVKNCRLSGPNRLLGAEVGVGARRQRETPVQSGYRSIMFILVTKDQSVVCIQLIIESRTECGASIRSGNGGSEGHDVQIRIQNRGVNHSVVVDISLFKVEEERSLLLRNRPAQIASVIPRQVRRARGRERITRIEVLIIETEAGLSAKSVSAGLRQNLDAAESWPIEL